MADEHLPHIAAIARTRDAGFRFLHLRDGSEVIAIHGLRWRAGSIDTYTIRAAGEAVAARYRAEDYGLAGRGPLWQLTGTVAEVIAELLELPAHGSPGAPVLELRPSSSLWVPSR